MRFQVQGLSRFFRLLQQVGRRFNQDDCFNLAASLTFTTLLALVPLVTIGLAIFSAFPAFKQFTVGVNEFIAQTMLPEAVGKIVQTHLEEFTRSAGKLTALGFTVLTVTAVLLMQTIDGALQRIFRVRRKRPLGLRVLVYWGVLTLGPLLIGASLSLTSYFMRASMSVARQYDAVRALDLIPLALTAIAFTLLFYIVPNRRVLFRQALLGGLGAAILFESMKRIFAYYIAQFPTYTLIYGAFAAIPIFLLWIYLSWLVTLLGAVFAAALSNWSAFGRSQVSRVLAPFGESLDQVLRVLRSLVRAHRHSRVLTTTQIAGRLGLMIEDAERILDELVRGGWVARAVGERWALACDAHTTTVAEVCDGLLFGSGDLTSPLTEIRLSTMQRLDVPLATLVDVPDGQAAPHSQA
ncbi:MAG TPA: YihY family inner membrane protein [Burkholderiales bacterium]|jgi:membrane protein|nr:YihY family inner membrane protein [Burkholderiales bacterium]